MTIADNLILLNSTKQDIKAAIEAKGVDMTDVPFTDYDTKIGEITTGGAIPIIPDYTPWTRNAQWLTLPTVNASDDEQIIMLVRVDNTTYNELIFSMQGAYTVDWGDGTVTNYASGAVAYRNYDYNNVALNGTLTSDGYKQAICKVTLQAAGTTFSRIDFNTVAGKVSNTTTKPVLDMIIHSRNAATYLLGGYSVYDFRICERVELVTYDRTSALNLFNGFNNLQKLVLRNNALNSITNAQTLFNTCYAIKEIPYFDVSSVTDAAFMFGSCYSLVDIGAFNFNSISIASNTFNSCYSLVDLRHITFNAPINLNTAFASCTKLQYLPIFNDMSNIANYNTTFQNCYSLLELPANLNMMAVTSAALSVFNGCSSLTTIPAITTTATTLSNWFNGCSSINTFGGITANSATVATGLFRDCNSIDLSDQTVNLPSVTTVNQIFQGCKSSKITFSNSVNITGSVNAMFSASTTGPRLRDVVINANLVGVTDCGNMFLNQSAIDEINIATFTTNGTASTSGMFSGVTNLKKLILGGFNQTFSISFLSLGATELNALYTSLGTVTGKTITVTGNPGTTGDNPAIATAKGWTVTG